MSHNDNMQSSDGKTWVPAVPVDPKSVGAFSLRYRIMFKVRAFFAKAVRHD